jgi:selenocysteine lyase/cysteine desulfurase
LGDGPARCHRKQYIAAFVGVERTVRASLALYNSGEDIDAVVSALLRIQAGFRS